MKISSSKSEAMVIDLKRMAYPLQVGGQLGHPGEVPSRAAVPPHGEKPVEVDRAFIQDAHWSPPLAGVPGTSHQEEAQGTAQDTPERCLLAGLGMPWAPPGGAGGGFWGEGHLGVSTESAAP
ncbi:hypothetical protein ILYODFUR_034170, partial [Ilyodon furcidens]